VEISLSYDSLSPFILPPPSPKVPGPTTEISVPVDSERLDEPREDQEGQSSNSEGKGKFKGPSVSLPVAISHDLRRAVILDVAIKINIPDSSNDVAYMTDKSTFKSQILDFRIQNDNKESQDEKKKSWLPDVGALLRGKERRNEVRNELRNEPGNDLDDFYDIKFSPSGEHLVVIRESNHKQRKGDRLYGVQFSMQTFRDVKYQTTRGPKYKPLASLLCWAVPEISLLSHCRGVVFHPKLPRLAFSQVCDGLPQTYIWDLDAPVTPTKRPESHSNPFPVHDPPIVDPHFSDDGCYLYGTDAPIEYGFEKDIASYSTPLIVRVPDYVPVVASLLDGTVASRIQTNPFQNASLAKRAAFELSKRPKPPVQRANSLIFNQDGEGVVHVSHLHQLEKEGAVVLHSFGTNGKFQSDTLSRLPDMITKCADVSVLHSSLEAASNQVRVVLNKAPQRQYTAEDVANDILPAVIERTKESIPSFITTVHMPLGLSEGASHDDGTHRLSWREDSEA
jgi:hypothetical protein